MQKQLLQLHKKLVNSELYQREVVRKPQYQSTQQETGLTYFQTLLTASAGALVGGLLFGLIGAVGLFFSSVFLGVNSFLVIQMVLGLGVLGLVFSLAEAKKIMSSLFLTFLSLLSSLACFMSLKFIDFILFSWWYETAIDFLTYIYLQAELGFSVGNSALPINLGSTGFWVYFFAEFAVIVFLPLGLGMMTGFWGRK